MSASDWSDAKWRRRHLCQKLICRNLSILSYRRILGLFAVIHAAFFIVTIINNGGSDVVAAVAIPMFVPVLSLLALIIVQPIPERKLLIARIILANLVLFVAFIGLDIYALVYFEGGSSYYSSLSAVHIVVQILAYNLLYQYYSFISYHYDPSTRDALLSIAPFSDGSLSFNFMRGSRPSAGNSAGTPTQSPLSPSQQAMERPSSLSPPSSAGRGSLMIEDGFVESSLHGQSIIGTGPNIFLMEYASNGTRIWTRLLGSSTGTAEQGYAVGVYGTGSIYVTGVAQGSISGETYVLGDDLFISSYENYQPPSISPTFQPATTAQQPTALPTSQPSSRPSAQPSTTHPSIQPTGQPTSHPTETPDKTVCQYRTFRQVGGQQGEIRRHRCILVPGGS
eukprot:gene24412-29512_t